MYKQIYQYAYPIDGEQPLKECLGDRNNRKCIFCGREDGETTFRKDAHIIPAALGNKTLFNYCECDICNEHVFSAFENELTNLLQLDRILVRGRPRRGFPKYRPGKSESFITSTPGTNQVQIQVDKDEQAFELEELDDGSMFLKYESPSYIMTHVCKALVHIGWSVIPADIKDNFQYVWGWLKGDITILPLHIDKAFIPGTGMKHVVFEIWTSDSADSVNYPLIFRLTYGFTVLTFYLPIDPKVDQSPKRFIHLTHVPAEVEIDVKCLSIINEQRVKPENAQFTIRYGSKEDFTS